MLRIKQLFKSTSAVLLLSASVSACLRANAQEFTQFTDWCIQQDQLPEAEQYTVSVLLEIAGDEDCQAANNQLLSLTTLDLTNRQITNLAPLSALPQLQSLYLGQNQISDLRPLEYLTDLADLYLLDNQVTDLSPIANLQNLATLYLDNNQVEDLSPLENLRSLTTLYANNNQITSVEPLASLPNLTELYLAQNQITDVEELRSQLQLTNLDLAHNRIADSEPLALLNRLVELDLSHNQISQVEALAALQNLVELNLRDNPLSSKTCPIRPATVCLFTDDAADLYHLGEQQTDQGEFAAALATFQTALQVYQSGGDQLRVSDTLDRIGNVYDEMGQYANSLDYYQQSANIRQTVGDPQGESDTLTNLGVTYIRLGQTEKALDLLQQALAIHQNLTNRDRSWRRPEPREGIILSSLALAYSKTGDQAAALRFAKQSLASYRSGNDPAGEARALNRVGEAYLSLGDAEKARLYLEKALGLTQAQNDPAGTGRSLQNLGDLAASLGDSATALDQYRQARRVQQAIGDAAGEGETLNAMGELFLQTGQQTAAVEALQAAIALWESLRPGLTDEDKISLAETQASTYRLLQQALVNQDNIATALEISERGRARAFAELLAHRLALQGQTPPSDQFEPPTIDQIQQIAQAQNATLVEYSLVDEEVYIWVVQPTGEIHFRQQSLDEKAIADWVTDNRLALGVRDRGIAVVQNDGAPMINPETVEAIEAADQANRQQLYQLLVEPIAELLPTEPDAPVIIIPQGELFLVPFPALADANGTDLIENHSLLLAPAISLLVTNPTQREPLHIGTDPALVVGNPIMPNDPSTRSPLPPLSGAEQEALDIAPILNTEPLIGAAATKAVIVEQLSEVAIAHFATHGLLDDFGTGIPGALALAPTPNDNGFLTTAEIFALPTQARLVVLSACNTGRGNITGDGVLGLSRSFLTAGVENVVVSLWAVPDEPTALLMTEFYQALQQNPNHAVALRQAMLATRSVYPQPVNWAAFTLFGRMNE